MDVNGPNEDLRPVLVNLSYAVYGAHIYGDELWLVSCLLELEEGGFLGWDDVVQPKLSMR